MPRKNTPQYMISSYQKKSSILPVLIWIIAGLIFGAGILILVLWFTGDGGGSIKIPNLFASATPTATETFTPTPTVPTATPTMTATATETPTPTYTETPSGPQMYTVQEFEGCWDIAVNHNVNYELFLSINNLDAEKCQYLNPGDQVIIPSADQKMPTETPFPLDQYTYGQQIEYTVQMDDNYILIANKFNSTIESLAKLNEIEDTLAYPRIGDKLIVAVNLVTPTPSPVPTYTEVPSGQ